MSDLEPKPALDTVAPAFVEMAHRIVWCVAATVDTRDEPRTRVLHPIWEFTDGALTGWVLTSPLSVKAGHLERHPGVSLTYWEPGHDTCTADCHTVWENSPEQRRAGWDRFLHADGPVAYDPSIIPPWTDPDAPGFGVLRLDPIRLRVQPGSIMTSGRGEVLTWKR